MNIEAPRGSQLLPLVEFIVSPGQARGGTDKELVIPISPGKREGSGQACGLEGSTENG